MKLIKDVSISKLLFLFIFALIVGFLSMLPMVFLQRAVDFSVNNEGLSRILSNGLAYIGIYVISYSLRLFTLNTASKIDNIAKQNIRDQLYGKIAETRVPVIEQTGRNHLINLCIDNIKELDEDIFVTIVKFIFTLSSFITGILIMAKYSMKILLIVIPLSIISTSIINLSAKKSSSLAEEASAIRNKTWQMFVENILGHREIFLYNQQERLDSDYRCLSSHWKNIENNRVRIENRWAMMASLSFSIFIGIIIIIGTRAIINNSLSVGALVAILMYNHMITDPVFSLIENQKRIFKIITAIKNLNHIFDELSNNELDKGTYVENIEKIELKNISINYEGRKILKDFNLTINRFDKVLIIGKSGIGKSTLLKLFTGAYYADEGEILVNNIPIHKIRMPIGYIFQDDTLFHGTIIDNIKFSNLTIDEFQLNKIIKIAHLEDLINDYGQADIGDAGVKLSGGEKKRVLLARALASNAELFLFDELSAGLDYKLFQTIINDILENYADKTIIFIEHEELDFCKFDKVIDLSNNHV